MRPIRIALAGMQPALCELVRQVVAGQPDLVLAGGGPGEIGLLLRARDVDVVVMPLRGAEPPAGASRLLDENPDLGVVCLDPAGGRGLVCRLQLRTMATGPLSPASVAAAIRAAGRVEPGRSDAPGE